MLGAALALMLLAPVGCKSPHAPEERASTTVPTETPRAPRAPSTDESDVRKAPGGAPSSKKSGKKSDEEDEAGTKPPFRPHKLDSFYRGLYKAESDSEARRVRILHVGDSHTASDTITGRVRELFQDKFGETGRGYAYPGKPWRTFRQEQMTYDMSREWESELGTTREPKPPFAAGGVRVETSSEGAWIERGTCDPEDCTHGRQFDRWAVFYLVQEDGGSFEVSIDGERPTLIETAGESREVGVFRRGVEPGPHKLRIETTGDGPVALFGIRTSLGDNGVEYTSLGINGATAPEFAGFDRNLTRQEIGRINPDLLVFAFGTNEAFNLYRMHQDTDVSMEKITQKMANYQIEFDALLGRYISAAPQASCLVLLPPDVAPPRDDVPCRQKLDMGGDEKVCIPPTLRNFAGIVATQKAAARRHGCAVWDQSHAMGGQGSIQKWAHLKPELARTDGVHLTMDGYDLLAEAFFADVMRTYEMWKEGGNMPLRTRPIQPDASLNASRNLTFGFH